MNHSKSENQIYCERSILEGVGNDKNWSQLQGGSEASRWTVYQCLRQILAIKAQGPMIERHPEPC